jgi:acetolactate synthase-1/2/3 large subunit
MTEKTRAADAIAAVLHAHGVRHAFGMPGGEVLTLLDGLRAAGIAFHLARNETAAAIMAAGVHAATGVPGVLLTTIGPGLANAVNGILDAAQERVPLIVLSGVVDRSVRGRFTHQVLDQAALLRAVVKASFEAEPETAADVVARALRLALTPPMGPVHVDVSPETAAALARAPRPEPARVAAPVPSTADPLLASVRAALAAAERPLVIAGLEAARGGCEGVLTALAERIGAPVLTTYKAKGVISEDHPLALGGAGLSPAADRVLLDLVGRADRVLMLGYDPIEMRIGWLDPVADPARTIEIGVARPDHGMHNAGTVVAADPAAALEVLLDGLPRKAGWPGGEPAEARRALQRTFSAEGRGWGPHAVIATLSAVAGEDAIVTVDSGAHRILLSQMWTARRPLRLLQSAGLCTMAGALPLAIGAKVAAPDRRVFAVMGDGGLEMCLGELATLRDIGHPVVVVVFQDESLALIDLKQRALQLARAGVALGATDFAAIADAMGGVGRTVRTARDLVAELSAAVVRDTFSLIACRFDADAYQDAF